MTDTTPDLGRKGENLAARYLTNHGLTLLSRNWRCRDGELDVIATDGDTPVVCEVKTRSTDDYGEPIEYVTPVKIQRIKRATREWLRRYRRGWPDVVRFDILAILWPPEGDPEVRHVRGAF